MPHLERDGARIAYDVSGTGPDVLMIQGAGVAGSGWRPQVESLRGQYRTITFDNRGFGQSSRGSRRPSIEDLAGDALAVLDACGSERAHVMGHSMGGLIAQALALSAPARVRSLSLLCTFDRGRSAAMPSFGVMWDGIQGRFGSAARRRRVFLGLVLTPAQMASVDVEAKAQELGQLFGRELAVQPPEVFDQIRAMGAFDASARLGELGSIPTLVVSGELDRIATPRFGRALAALIPGARYVELSGAGHALPIVEHREALDALLLEHLAAAR